MIDLTDAFKDALNRKGKQPWRYAQANALAMTLSKLIPGAETDGTGSENWLWIEKDDKVLALVYQVAPLVIVNDELAEAAKSVLQPVVVVAGLRGYDDDLFSMNPDEASNLLPYPLEHDVWDWGGFAASDLVAETI